jgi:hypothetical protein
VYGGVAGAAYNNTFRENSYGFSGATTQTITANYVAEDPNVYNNQFLDNTWSPTAYVNSYVTKYAFPVNQVRNYAIEAGLQVAGVLGGGTTFAPYQTNPIAITYIAATDPTIGAAQKLVLVSKFATQNAQGVSVFNGATNAFVAPCTGYLKISASLTFYPVNAAAVNQAIQVMVYKNGVPEYTRYLTAGLPAINSRATLPFDITIDAKETEIFQIYASVANSGAGALLSVLGDVDGTVVFQII